MQPYSLCDSLTAVGQSKSNGNMWKNYLKIAIRNSIKDKHYIIINVFGLGVAMALGLTIYLFHAYNIECIQKY